MKLLRESNLFNKRSTERRSVVGSMPNMNNWNIYRQTRLNPHQEMEYCVDMFNRNSIACASLTTMKDFIKGGELVVKSKDEESRQKVQQYLNDLDVDYWLDEAIENAIKTGNGYLELDFSDSVKDVVKKVYPISDSARIYINCDEYGNPVKTKKMVTTPNGEQTYNEVLNTEEYYVQKIDPNYDTYNGAKYFSLRYLFGGMFNQYQIYGIPIPKENMIHIKFGLGDIGIYGRSVLASTITDYEILEQIERSLAIIAKHKAVPRDIITYGNEQNPATDDELNDFIIYLESLQKEQSAIVNKPINRETISYSGEDINLDYMIQHIKKKLTAGIAPEFAIGMASDNKQTSQLTLLSYILSIYSKRKLILKPIEDRILKPFIQRMGLQDCWLEFGELDFETKNEKTNRVGSLWTQNVLTLNETRFQLGFPILEQGNMFFSQWQQTLLSNTDDTDGDGIPDGLDSDNSDEDNEIKGSPGANTQEPNQRLPNNDDPNEVFNHRDAPNQKTKQKGGRMDFDVHRPTTKNKPRLLKKKTNSTYNELMDDIRKLEQTINLSIELPDSEKNESDIITINFDTMMTKFAHMFKEPMTTELFYSESDGVHTMKFKTPNNVMVVCNFTNDDIIGYYDKDFRLSDQDKENFVLGWIAQYTNKSIEVMN